MDLGSNQASRSAEEISSRKKGEAIPEKKLAAVAKKPGKLGQRARLADTLKHLRKK